MKALLTAALVIDLYVLVYYRLMVRYHLERHSGERESALAALLSFAPYSRLDAAGRKYARRHIAAVVTMGVVVVCAVLFTDVRITPPEAMPPATGDQ